MWAFATSCPVYHPHAYCTHTPSLALAHCRGEVIMLADITISDFRILFLLTIAVVTKAPFRSFYLICMGAECQWFPVSIEHLRCGKVGQTGGVRLVTCVLLLVRTEGASRSLESFRSAIEPNPQSCSDCSYCRLSFPWVSYRQSHF